MSATYQIHPAAELFPRLRGREFEELAESIRRDGLKVPIVLFGDTVIDGRNRLAACESVGVKPTFVQWTPAGEESPWDYVWSLNATRRHLRRGTLPRPHEPRPGRGRLVPGPHGGSVTALPVPPPPPRHVSRRDHRRRPAEPRPVEPREGATGPQNEDERVSR